MKTQCKSARRMRWQSDANYITRTLPKPPALMSSPVSLNGKDENAALGDLAEK